MVELAFALTLLAVAGGMVAAGAYVARAKGRPPVEGALLSFVLGPIGVLVEVLLPTIDADEGAGLFPVRQRRRRDGRCRA